MFANYHTHTFRCHHATGTEREYIERAIQNGVRILGFSDHAPHLFPKGKEDCPPISTSRMAASELADYCTILTDLKREYAGQIELHIGLEMEYFPELFRLELDWMRDYPIEYLLLGQHWLHMQPQLPWCGATTDDEAKLNAYVDQTTEALETGCFTYFAHPDLVHYIGPSEIYHRSITRLCKTARRLNIPLELNLLGLTEHRAYPNAQFWPIVRETGCTVVIGCDAHNPDAVANPDILRRAQDYLAQFGLTAADAVPLRSPFRPDNASTPS